MGNRIYRRLNQLLRRIKRKLRPAPKSLYELAVEAGVKIECDNLIESNFWYAAEPYLIQIGSHCQITHNVMMFTHGWRPSSKAY